MPMYLCYCPDYPNNLQQRLATRPSHFERAALDKVPGKTVMTFGTAFLSPTPEGTDPYPSDPAAPNPRMAGSVMHFDLPSLEACWERIKDDPYWKEGVWDKEKLVISELLPAAPKS